MNFPQIVFAVLGFDISKSVSVVVTRYYIELLIDINERIMGSIRKVLGFLKKKN